MSERQIVIDSWNKIAPLYHANRDHNKINGELQEFINLLPQGAKVLDAGSGSGVPVAKFLVDKCIEVIGIDISENMLKMARKNVPNAKFENMDMRELQFEENSFDGVISVFSLFHVPKKDHFKIFQNFYKVLKSGGILLINTGVSESEGISNFFGEPMFWSNHDPKKTLELVKTLDFSIIFEGVLVRGGEFQYWIFARKD